MLHFCWVSQDLIEACVSTKYIIALQYSQWLNAMISSAERVGFTFYVLLQSRSLQLRHDKTSTLWHSSARAMTLISPYKIYDTFMAL